MNKHYSKQFKTEIVGKYLDGQSISDISVETGVSRSTLYSWIESEKNYFTSKANLNLRDYHFLKSKCDRQEKIIEILKKSPCSVSAPLRNRYEAIKALKSDYSESLLCDALNVLKGSYYNLIPPRTPWHNGKIERNHRNDQRCFYNWETIRCVEELNKN